MKKISIYILVCIILSIISFLIGSEFFINEKYKNIDEYFIEEETNENFLKKNYKIIKYKFESNEKTEFKNEFEISEENKMKLNRAEIDQKYSDLILNLESMNNRKSIENLLKSNPVMLDSGEREFVYVIYGSDSNIKSKTLKNYVNSIKTKEIQLFLYVKYDENYNIEEYELYKSKE